MDTGEESRLPLLNEQSKTSVATIFCNRNPLVTPDDPSKSPIDECCLQLELKTCTKQTLARK